MIKTLLVRGSSRDFEYAMGVVGSDCRLVLVGVMVAAASCGQVAGRKTLPPRVRNSGTGSDR